MEPSSEWVVSKQPVSLVAETYRTLVESNTNILACFAASTPISAH